MKREQLIKELEKEYDDSITMLKNKYDVDYDSIPEEGLKYWNDEWDTGEMIVGCYLVGRIDMMKQILKQLKGIE